MSMDLVISDKGDVLIASNVPFAAEVMRVDFLPEKRLLTLNYQNAQEESETLNVEVHDRMMGTLLRAPSVLMVYFKNGQPEEGFDVPLMQIEDTLASS